MNEFWKLSKMTIIKPCEQLLLKSFYFAPQFFLELLNDIERLHEFLQNFRKCLSASIKSLKAAGPKGKIENRKAGGLFAKCRLLLPCSDRATVELAPVVATAPALAPCRPSPGGQEDPHDALPAPLSFLSPFLPFSRISTNPSFCALSSVVPTPSP